MEKYHTLQQNPKMIRELKIALELILEDVLKERINMVITGQKKTQNMCGTYWWWTRLSHDVVKALYCVITYKTG